jgi:hypothetical protein
MTDQETNLQNAFVTTLTAELGPTALTADVVSIGSLTTPCYLVVNMESDSLREYILFDGTFGATSFVATNIDKRYLAGSAAPSNLTHPIGASVQVVAMQQHFEDLNDRIDAIDAVTEVAAADAYLKNDGDTLEGTLNLGNQSVHSPLDPTAGTGVGDRDFNDARYALITSTRIVLPWSAGMGKCEVGTEAAAFRWIPGFACTLVAATPTAGTAPTGAAINFDVSNDGTTMFSTKPTIAAAAQDGVRQTPSVTAIGATDVIRAWISQIGSTLPGENVALALEITVP